MCQGIPLATKGMIYHPSSTVIAGETRYVMPFNLNLTANNFKLTLKSLEVIKLSSVLNTRKLNLIQLPSLKLSNRLSSLKLSLKM